VASQQPQLSRKRAFMVHFPLQLLEFELLGFAVVEQRLPKLVERFVNFGQSLREVKRSPNLLSEVRF